MVQLTLQDDEIRDAISQYVSKQGIETSDKVVKIKIKSGRKGNGLTAIVSVENKPEPETKIAKEATSAESSTGEVTQEDKEAAGSLFN